MKINWVVIIVALALPGATSAQHSSLPQSTAPHATIIRPAKIRAAVERTNTGALSDALLSVVPIESKYNVDNSVFRRPSVPSEAPAASEAGHAQMTTALPKAFYDAVPKTFYKAFVEPSNSNSSGHYSYRSKPGRLSATNVPLHDIIRFSYELKPWQQIMGLPAWARELRYNISYEDAPGTVAAIHQITDGLPLDQKKQAWVLFDRNESRMIQSLLAEQLGLRAHWETKEGPGYVLTVARGGPKLKPASASEPRMGIHIRETNGHASARGATMWLVTQMLSRGLGLPVIDETGLTGRYDFTLTCKPYTSRPGKPYSAQTSGGFLYRGPVPGNPPSDSIFGALPRELGLQLKPVTVPEQVLVIDHIAALR